MRVPFLPFDHLRLVQEALLRRPCGLLRQWTHRGDGMGGAGGYPHGPQDAGSDQPQLFRARLEELPALCELSCHIERAPPPRAFIRKPE